MDLARAIAKIDQGARYLLNHSQADGRQVILEWRGPGKEPSATMLRDAWDLCLDDDAAAAADEQEREDAAERIKADPAQADIAKVLGL